ncbi:oligosaccharide flippase family protein [Tenacibaculum maritimum]|uniref:oligosaccharide flippase family protein n=3 Tax=Tenacibaculum maritimum TaxID=107401 RepID=UPI0038768A9B
MFAQGNATLQKYKGLLANLGYLTVIKVFNLILPLIVFPYLLQTLGSQKYGLVIFAESIVVYLIIFISFGFALSGTKEISIHRDNKKKVNEIVSSVYIIKGVIFLISTFCFFIFSSFFLKYKEHQLLFFITMHLALYEFLFPFWVFQGIEKMKYITYIDLISRVVFVLLIFVYIKSPNDYLFVPTFQGIGSIISICIGLYILYTKEKIRFIIPPYAVIKKYAKESLLYFTSTLSIQVFTNSNRFLIGSFIGMTNLAYYDIVEKIIKILAVPTTVLRTVLIPFVNKTKDKKIVRNITKLMAMSSIFIVFGVWLFANEIIYLVTKQHHEKISYYLKIYSLIILLYNLSNYYLVVSLNAFGYQKLFMKTMLSSVALYLVLIFIIFLGKLFIVDYFISVLIIVELFIVFNTYHISYKKNLL